MSSIITSIRNGVRLIKLNSPQRRNALNTNDYNCIRQCLNDDSKTDQIRATIITGSGEFFSSGRDMKSSAQSILDSNQEHINELRQSFRNFIRDFVRYPKIIIAVVNGPSVGIGTTIVACCDVVYASDRATFHTPFVRLGLSAEAGSSYLFPMIMGRSRASEMLLLGKKITAKEAHEAGLVSKVIEHDKLDEFVESLYQYGDLPLNAVLSNKKLIKDNFLGPIEEVITRECDMLDVTGRSEEFKTAVRKFMARKNKL